MISHKTVLLVEFIAFFVVFPLLLVVFDLHYLLRIPLLIMVAVVFLVVLFRSRKFSTKSFLLKHKDYIIKKILPRFAIFAILLLFIAYMQNGKSFLALPFERTWFWLGMICSYIVLSVIPQGVIYRLFIFFRYRKIFHDVDMVIASSVVFSFMHILYQNPQAVVLTLIGGFFFADTYQKTESLPLSFLEHALYGVLLFTLGFGGYFLTK